MRSVTRSYRIRTYPNGAQRRLRDRWFGAYRWLRNTALEIRTEAYRECGLTLTGNDISRWLTQWKRTEGHEWLAEVPATCLTQCLRDQDTAFRNFYAGRARYPRFKRKNSSGSLRFQGAGWRHGILSLPQLGVLKLAEAPPEVERPDLVTLSHDAAGRYFVSFSAEMEKLPRRLKVARVQCPGDPRRTVQRDSPPARLQERLARQDPRRGRSLVSLEQDLLELPAPTR